MKMAKRAGQDKRRIIIFVEPTWDEKMTQILKSTKDKLEQGLLLQVAWGQANKIKRLFIKFHTICMFYSEHVLLKLNIFKVLFYLFWSQLLVDRFCATSWGMSSGLPTRPFPLHPGWWGWRVYRQVLVWADQVGKKAAQSHTPDPGSKVKEAKMWPLVFLQLLFGNWYI